MNIIMIDYCKQFVRKRISSKIEPIPKFIMLCGKDSKIEEEDNRYFTKEYLENNRDDTYVIYSEKLFDIIKEEKIDLLKFEELLFEISDGVILYLESFGTAAELGAFSYLDNLASKLLVFIPSQFETHKSFINLGPVERINSQCKVNESRGGAVFTDFNELENIDFSGENYSRIMSFSDEKVVSFRSDYFDIDDQSFVINIKPSIIVLFIIDIVHLFDFVEINQVKDLLKSVLASSIYKYNILFESNNQFDNNKIIDYIVMILINWKILREVVSKKSQKLLVCINYETVMSKKGMSSSIGKILFNNNMYKGRKLMDLRLKNRKLLKNLHGDIYE